MKALKAVFFDLDDTLCDDAAAWVVSANGAARIAVDRNIISSAEALVESFLRISEAYWMSLQPVTETRTLIEIRRQQWAEALQQSSAVVDNELALALAADYGHRRSTGIKLYPDAVDTLRTLRENGIKLALLTNGVQLTHLEKINFLGLEALVDHVLIADIVGSFKPDQMIFREALFRCSCQADEAVMVGDHLRNDVGGAQAVGIMGYWFNPAGIKIQAGDPIPKAQIKTLSELLGLLEPRLA